MFNLNSDGQMEVKLKLASTSIFEPLPLLPVVTVMLSIFRKQKTKQFVVFRRELLRIRKEEPGTGRLNFIFCQYCGPGYGKAKKGPPECNLPPTAGSRPRRDGYAGTY